MSLKWAWLTVKGILAELFVSLSQMWIWGMRIQFKILIRVSLDNKCGPWDNIWYGSWFKYFIIICLVYGFSVLKVPKKKNSTLWKIRTNELKILFIFNFSLFFWVMSDPDHTTENPDLQLSVSLYTNYSNLSLSLPAKDTKMFKDNR